MIASFSLGPGGAVGNVRPTNYVGPLDANTLRVVHDHGAITIHALHDGRVVQVATAILTSSDTLKRRRAMPAPVVAWHPIVVALRTVLERPNIAAAGDITIAPTVATETVTPPRPAFRWPRLSLLSVAGFGLVAFVVGGTAVRVIQGVLAVESLAITVPLGLGGAWLLVRGLAILGSEEARTEPSERGSDGKREPGPIARGGLLRVMAGGMLYAVVAIGIYGGSWAGKKAAPAAPAPSVTPASRAPSSPSPAPSPSRAAASSPPPAPLAVRVASARDFAAAIALSAPQFADGADNEGAWLLARYARLTWAELQATGAETTVPLVLKDAARERGKRLCATGTIDTITRRDLERRPVHVGALQTTEGDRVRFIALGSTGLLVKRSAATFCGIATGTAGDAAGDAVIAVGLFDLPENAAPSVER